MQGKLIASYRRELSALDDLQCAGTVTYTLTQEADAFVITVQRDGARAAACMLCEIEEERAGMLTRFLYKTPWSLRRSPRYCMTSVDRRWADMAVLLHDRPEAAGQKQREALRLPRTSAVVALFAFSSRMDRDSMRLFARTHGDEVRAAAIASTGQEVLELLHGGLRPQVLVLDALLTKPSVTQVLQEIGTMQLDPEPAVLVLVPVPEETAARKALGLFAQYRIMLRPYGMKNLFDEIYRMGTTDDEHRLYHLRRCCEDVLDDFGAQSTLNGYRYAERMLLYALYAERPQKIGDLQQYVASEENIEIGTVTSALNRMSAGMSKRGAEPYRGLCLRCGRPENGVLSNGQLFEGLLKELRRRLEPTV